jgi:hypothetical protein
VNRITGTQRVLAGMLTENTGRHILDSGGAYGRNFERNAGRTVRDFISAPDASLEFTTFTRNGELEWWIDASLNVFHWLDSILDYDSEADRRFRRWATRGDRKDEHWMTCMEEYPAWLRTRGHEVTGLYGEGEPFTVNTYNGEDILSQVLQYLYLEIDGTPYVLLQIHGGCDVRGGYTRPRMFRVCDEGSDIMDNARATISCGCHGPAGEPLPGMPAARDYPHYWSTDDTCNWYQDGTCGAGYTNLEDCPATTEASEAGQGMVYIDPETHVGHCPHDGTPLRLSA